MIDTIQKMFPDAPPALVIQVKTNLGTALKGICRYKGGPDQLT